MKIGNTDLQALFPFLFVLGIRVPCQYTRFHPPLLPDFHHLLHTCIIPCISMYPGFNRRVLDVVPQYIVGDEVWSTRREWVERELEEGCCNIVFETIIAGAWWSVE